MEKVIILIEGIIAKEVTDKEAMDWIFSEYNTEEHPLRIFDKNGKEIEW